MVLSTQEQPRKYTFDQEFEDNKESYLDQGPTVEERIAAARAEGVQEGLSQGQSQTMQTMQQEFQTHLSKIDQALQSIEIAQQNHFQFMHTQALALVQHLMSIALGDAYKHFAEDVLRSRLHDLLAPLNAGLDLKLHVHPSTAAFARNHLQENPSLQKLNASIQEDPSLQAGDFMAEWDTGGIDGKLETLLLETTTLLEQAAASPITAPPTEEMIEESPEESTPQNENEDA